MNLLLKTVITSTLVAGLATPIGAASASRLAATLSDFIPVSIILDLAFATGRCTASAGNGESTS